MDTLDLIIIGGAPAGTAAGIYAARRGLKFKILTKDFGGEMALSGEIGNWPGVPETDGVALTAEFKKHLEHYKVDLEEGVWVESIEKEEGEFTVKTSKGEYKSKVVIIATGVHPRLLGVPGEEEYRNKGVSYCTTCDGPLFSGKTTATIGGGNSALESALMLSELCPKVYVINKNDKFKGDQLLIDKLESKDNVEIIYEAMTKEIVGESGGFVKGLKYEKGGEETEIKLDGIFVHIGMIPNSDLVPESVEKDEFGYIETSKNQETSLPGLYAAGDVTTGPYNQIVIAAGEGTTALLSAVDYLNKLK